MRSSLRESWQAGKRGENEKSVQSDSPVRLDQTSRKSDARQFIASILKHNIIWKKFPGVTVFPVHKEAITILKQLKADAISSKKMGSRAKLPVLV